MNESNPSTLIAQELEAVVRQRRQFEAQLQALQLDLKVLIGIEERLSSILNKVRRPADLIIARDAWFEIARSTQAEDQMDDPPQDQQADASLRDVLRAAFPNGVSFSSDEAVHVVQQALPDLDRVAILNALSYDMRKERLIGIKKGLYKFPSNASPSLPSADESGRVEFTPRITWFDREGQSKDLTLDSSTGVSGKEASM